MAASFHSRSPSHGSRIVGNSPSALRTVCHEAFLQVVYVSGSGEYEGGWVYLFSNLLFKMLTAQESFGLYITEIITSISICINCRLTLSYIPCGR